MFYEWTPYSKSSCNYGESKEEKREINNTWIYQPKCISIFITRGRYQCGGEHWNWSSCIKIDKQGGWTHTNYSKANDYAKEIIEIHDEEKQEMKQEMRQNKEGKFQNNCLKI